MSALFAGHDFWLQCQLMVWCLIGPHFSLWNVHNLPKMATWKSHGQHNPTSIEMCCISICMDFLWVKSSYSLTRVSVFQACLYLEIKW